MGKTAIRSPLRFSLRAVPLPLVLCLLCLAGALARPAPVNLTNDAAYVAMASNGDYVVIAGGANAWTVFGTVLVLHADGTVVDGVDLYLSKERSASAASLVKDEVWLCGGSVTAGPVADVDVINLSNFTIRAASPLPVPLTFSSPSSNGHVLSSIALIAGGRNDSATRNGFIYDYGSNGPPRNINLSVGRDGAATTTALADGILYTVFAGGQSTTGVLSSIEVFNHSSGTWVPNPPTLSAARFLAAASSVGPLVIIAGGSNGINIRSEIDIFDLRTMTLIRTLRMALPRYLLAATSLGPYVYLGSGQIYSNKVVPLVEMVDTRDFTVSMSPENVTGPGWANQASASSTFAAFFAGGRNEDVGFSPIIDMFVCGNDNLDKGEECDDSNSLLCKFCKCLAKTYPCNSGRCCPFFDCSTTQCSLNGSIAIQSSISVDLPLILREGSILTLNGTNGSLSVNNSLTLFPSATLQIVSGALIEIEGDLNLNGGTLFLDLSVYGTTLVPIIVHGCLYQNGSLFVAVSGDDLASIANGSIVLANASTVSGQFDKIELGGYKAAECHQVVTALDPEGLSRLALETTRQPCHSIKQEGIPFWAWIVLSGSVLVVVLVGLTVYFTTRDKAELPREGFRKSSVSSSSTDPSQVISRSDTSVQPTPMRPNYQASFTARESNSAALSPPIPPPIAISRDSSARAAPTASSVSVDAPVPVLPGSWLDQPFGSGALRLPPKRRTPSFQEYHSEQTSVQSTAAAATTAPQYPPTLEAAHL